MLHRRALRDVLCALLLAWTSAVHASPTSTAVLTDRTGPALEQAFVDPADDVSLADAQIHTDHVDLRACEHAGACVDVKLTRAHAGCSGAMTPAFCVSLGDASGPFADRLLRVLSRVPATVWQVRSAPPPTSPWAKQRVWLQLGLAGLALLLLLAAARGRVGALLALSLASAGLGLWHSGFLVAHDAVLRAESNALKWEAVAWFAPVALGLLAGSLAFVWPRLRAVFVASPLLLALVPFAWPGLGLWDAIWMASWALLVALWHTDYASLRARRWGFAVVVFLVGLACVEGALRRDGRAPPLVEDSRVDLLSGGAHRPADSTLAAWNEALFAEPTAFSTLRAQSPHGPWVLHIGDSMLFGAGIAPTDAVPAQLQKVAPSPVHVNAGVPASSLDLQYALAVRLLAAWHAPRVVVLHVFPANDLSEMDLPVALCGGHRVLSPVDSPVEVTCKTREVESPFARLAHAPLPLTLQRAAQWSWLARRLVAAHHSAVLAAEAPDPGQVLRHYGQIVQALRDALHNRQIPLVVAFMPSRPGTTQDHGDASRKLHAVFESLGLPALDSQPLFDKRVASGEEHLLFLPDHDVHFAPPGASAYAVWLAPHLP